MATDVSSRGQGRGQGVPWSHVRRRLEWTSGLMLGGGWLAGACGDLNSEV